MAAPLPLIFRNPPLRLCSHHLLYPPLSIAKTSTKPLSLISYSPTNTRSFPILNSTQMEGDEITEEITETTQTNVVGKKKIFVAGATGNTGKRIVEQLLAKGLQLKLEFETWRKPKLAFPKTTQLFKLIYYGWDLFAPWKVDNFGTVNLVEACRKLGVNRFILVSSILVNGAAMGQILNPAYIFLNVFGLTLIAKLQAEQYIRKSGNLVMEPEDTLSDGSISRDLVAEVAIEALVNPEALYKVVEIVSRPDAPKRSYEDLFGSIKQR
ncbi:uncharacterized protein Pyn_15768 [Prunus yedoensis var. nudiflora]|uniref:NAD(P)-binding domain-containing protein n=1 Tax=Prunus yedoensis var. nudiflora TaxID=2094558 RepID=A0A314YCZ7_PRUYE|nr:uncharacterized protein Pyn_15768 [Prunus yedoensis var. nudiflora]